MALRHATLIMAVTLTLVGCGREKTLDVGEFAPYVQRFEAVGAQAGHPLKIDDLIIKLGSMDRPSEQGYCTLSTDETPRVTISSSAWPTLDDTEREALIFHELGHCILIRRHDSSTLTNGDPATLMNPYAMDAYTYMNRLDYYHQELFVGH